MSKLQHITLLFLIFSNTTFLAQKRLDLYFDFNKHDINNEASKKINCSKTLPTSLLFNPLISVLTHPLNAYLLLLFLSRVSLLCFSISEKTYENQKV